MSRLSKEQARLRDAFPLLQPVERDGEAVLEGPVAVGEGTRHIRVGWPAAFPNVPPWLMEIDPTTGAWLPRGLGADGLSHQFPDGTLCLFPHAATDGWHPARSTVEVVERFRALVDRHPAVATPPQAHNRAPQFWIHPNLLAAMNEVGSHGHLEVRARINGDNSPDSLYVVTAVITEDTHWTRHEDQNSMAWASEIQLIQQLNIPWFHPELPRRLTFSQESLDDLISHIPPALKSALTKTGQIALISRGDLAPELFILQSVGIYGTLMLSILPYDPHRDLFARLDGAVPGHESLRDAHAVIIGCGSLGGEIARQLARAGVGRFTLFDGDRVEVANLCRQIGGTPAIGFHKVLAVAQEIVHTNPLAKVEAMAFPITWDYALTSNPTQPILTALLADPKTLFILTTATAELERGLNLLCVEAGRPAVYASVLGRAEYGRVFRVLPGETPCYDCIAQTHAEDPGTHWVWQGEAAPGQPAYRQAGIPGLGMDIQQVALLAARLSLQTFRRIAPGLDYPDAHADHFVWSNHGGDGFDHPLQLRVERYARHPHCGICA